MDLLSGLLGGLLGAGKKASDTGSQALAACQSLLSDCVRNTQSFKSQRNLALVGVVVAGVGGFFLGRKLR